MMVVGVLSVLVLVVVVVENFACREDIVFCVVVLACWEKGVDGEESAG